VSRFRSVWSWAMRQAQAKGPPRKTAWADFIKRAIKEE
jgi:hypothetical protein